MTLEELRNSGLMILNAVVGSNAYGTNIATSDVDMRGIYRIPISERLSIISKEDEISDAKQDMKYYELGKFINLAKDCNPNIIEMLFLEPSFRVANNVGEHLLKNRHLFISKMAYPKHIGYAHSQIDKAKGQNKNCHNPQPEKMPCLEDFCFYIGGFNFENCLEMKDKEPARPIPIKEAGIDLTKYHCARLEQMAHTYRLYYYGDRAKGVFRGDNMLTVESIPLDDEKKLFAGLLIANTDLYEKAKRDWHSYWDWMKNRNINRWVDQEAGVINYDVKNMMHCVRLLLSGENILKNGEPIVHFKGAKLRFLKDIRANKFKYSRIMEYVNKKMEELSKLVKVCNLPETADIKKIDKLYQELIQMEVTNESNT